MAKLNFCKNTKTNETVTADRGTQSAPVAPVMYRVVRNDNGFAVAIAEGDQYLLHLVEGTEFNEKYIDRIVSELNAIRIFRCIVEKGCEKVAEDYGVDCLDLASFSGNDLITMIEKIQKGEYECLMCGDTVITLTAGVVRGGGAPSARLEKGKEV